MSSKYLLIQPSFMLGTWGVRLSLTLNIVKYMDFKFMVHFPRDEWRLRVTTCPWATYRRLNIRVGPLQWEAFITED